MRNKLNDKNFGILMIGIIGFLSKRLRNIFNFEVRHCFHWRLLLQVWNF